MCIFFFLVVYDLYFIMMFLLNFMKSVINSWYDMLLFEKMIYYNKLLNFVRFFFY